jgi:hypothetical protein
MQVFFGHTLDQLFERVPAALFPALIDPDHQRAILDRDLGTLAFCGTISLANAAGMRIASELPHFENLTFIDLIPTCLR